jgi:hypothetical protein
MFLCFVDRIRNNGYWIGLNDRAQNRKFMWVQTNQQVRVIATGLNDRAQNRKLMWVQKNQLVRVLAIGLNDRAQNRKLMWVQKNQQVMYDSHWSK